MWETALPHRRSCEASWPLLSSVCASALVATVLTGKVPPKPLQAGGKENNSFSFDYQMRQICHQIKLWIITELGLTTI